MVEKTSDGLRDFCGLRSGEVKAGIFSEEDIFVNIKGGANLFLQGKSRASPSSCPSR
jgi:hypothetical protein